MLNLLVLLLIIELLGLLVAIILFIPIGIHASYDDWFNVRDLKRIQLWWLIAPISIVVWVFNAVNYLIKVYTNPKAKL